MHIFLAIICVGFSSVAFATDWSADAKWIGADLEPADTLEVQQWMEQINTGSRKGRLQMENCGGMEWFYRSLAGIQPLENFPGFERFVLRPSCIEQLDWMKCEWNSPRGRIVSGWEKKDTALVWNIEIPSGSHALLDLSAGYAGAIMINGNDPRKIRGFRQLADRSIELAAGHYRLTLKRR